MKKRVLSLAVLLTLLLTVQAHAALYLAYAHPTLSFRGTTADCYGSVTTGSASSTIEATLTLWHGGTEVESWSGSGTGSLSLSGSCAVTKGESYTLTLDATVDGKPVSRGSTSGRC